MEAYLDNAATTRVFPEVRDIMLQVMEKDFGNPSSRHTKGIDAEGYVTRAVQQIASTLKCQPKEIVLTSGGTESNNMALIGTALANPRAGKHVITTRIEHASVHEPFGRLEQMEYETQYLPVDQNGHVLPEVLEAAVREDTLLVSVMMVNNEMGALEDIKKLSAIAKKKNPNVIFHVDAIQAYGKYKIVPKRMGIDLMSVSGHKIHGPKGSGFLYVRDGVKISPIILGGGQQRGMRSGTENVPAIAGMGEAIRIIYQDHAQKVEQLYALKKRLIDGLLAMEGVTVNGINEIALEETAPHIVSASFAGIKSEVMLHALAQEGVYVSSGSACSSNHPELSGTLRAIGVDERLLDSTLRFSFSVLSTPEEVDYALTAVDKVLPMLRRFIKK
ncbi:MAG TPA: cysteine desulfurase NifS [Lachnospiraceae bacterium]|jgi:cysteine desulfurase|nr:cysteine desulfurase NifS [Lachnospiraceae bacterium]